MARKVLTEEEKAARAAAKAKTEEENSEKQRAAQEAAKDSEIEALKKMVAEMQAQLAAAQRPQIIQVAQDTERVEFLWQAEVADDNVTVFGDGGLYGRIVGKTGTFSCPKSDLSRLLDSFNRYRLDQRQLIVLSGLTDEEREMLGIAYKEGELLDRRAFAKMVELGEEMLEIYPKLCDSHKEMVAKRYNEAYAEGNPKVTREIVAELHRMAKEAGRSGDFADILDRMNAQQADR